MPSRKKWGELLRSTFSAVGREDLTGLYKHEWRRAQEVLTTESGEPARTGGGRIRRFFRTTNQVLYGLARRLAPARRAPKSPARKKNLGPKIESTSDRRPRYAAFPHCKFSQF